MSGPRARGFTGAASVLARATQQVLAAPLRPHHHGAAAALRLGRRGAGELRGGEQEGEREHHPDRQPPCALVPRRPPDPSILRPGFGVRDARRSSIAGRSKALPSTSLRCRPGCRRTTALGPPLAPSQRRLGRAAGTRSAAGRREVCSPTDGRRARCLPIARQWARPRALPIGRPHCERPSSALAEDSSLTTEVLPLIPEGARCLPRISPPFILLSQVDGRVSPPTASADSPLLHSRNRRSAVDSPTRRPWQCDAPTELEGPPAGRLHADGRSTNATTARARPN